MEVKADEEWTLDHTYGKHNSICLIHLALVGSHFYSTFHFLHLQYNEIHIDVLSAQKLKNA